MTFQPLSPGSFDTNWEMNEQKGFIVRFGSRMDDGSAMPSMARLVVGPCSTVMDGPVLDWRHVFTKRLQCKMACA
jgi:hypothetical protein